MSGILHLVRPGTEPPDLAEGEQVVYTQPSPDAPFAVATESATDRRAVSADHVLALIFAAERVVVW